MFYTFIVKPLFDKLFAIILLICSSPLTIPISIILWFANNGKPFFVQKRPGKNEEIFSLIKFKTMNDKKDANGNLLPDSVRLTWIGKFVRKTSLDEIPQMLNVLKGDMSVVGPRPHSIPHSLESLNYVSSYTLRHIIKPGITGWAQVNGYRCITKNHFDMQNRVNYDLYYIRKWNFWLDCQIILQTIINLLKGDENVY